MHCGYCGTNRSAGIGKLMGPFQYKNSGNTIIWQIMSSREKMIGLYENDMQSIIVYYIKSCGKNYDILCGIIITHSNQSSNNKNVKHIETPISHVEVVGQSQTTCVTGKEER